MKRRFTALAAAAALSLAGTGTLIAGQASAADVRPSAATRSHAPRVPLFAGHAYLLTVDDGSVYRNTFSADGRSVTGLTVVGSNVGRTFTAPADAVRTGSKQFFISWIEPGGVTVSQVVDFDRHTVEFYVSSDDSTGALVGGLHHAKLSQVS
ncbi:hypothetical protein ACEZDB_37090 [Streptacidiphilus sp. N1-3]|uniref:MoaF-like domain-containing protein n=1 Tax=Streptacidiphilus alkalitolerans TaxID=3342712 RepID=A0ABV6XDB0_9ACTN